MLFLPYLVAALFPWLQSAPATAWRSEPVLVRAVTDGDTITVQPLGRVNLLGIEAPQLARTASGIAPFAMEAHERLAALVFHRWVRLETDGLPLTKAGRRAAYVLTEDGEFINGVLVREGLARVSARPGVHRLEELERAQRDAQLSRRGMWGAAPQIPSPRYTPPSVRSR
jgi:micrococcal nuclease